MRRRDAESGYTEQIQAIYGSNESPDPVIEELLQDFGKKKKVTFTTLEKEILGLVKTSLV